MPGKWEGGGGHHRFEIHVLSNIGLLYNITMIWYRPMISGSFVLSLVHNMMLGDTTLTLK